MKVENTNSSASTSTLKNQLNGTENNPAANLAASKGMLPEDTRRKLEGILAQLDEKPSSTNGKFLKIADGEELCLLFDPEKIEHTVITYPSKAGAPPSKPTKRIKFWVRVANGDGKVPADREEVEWTASETAGGEALRWLVKGFFLLDISRRGSGMNDTKYRSVPHI